ncbi:MAG TPA: hypothetical protein VL651_05940 [Bacteroidia bacterium]|nr:hypothetical protein [Bacteroidia bacterium]
MKNIITLLALVLLTITVKAQDIIKLTNGTEVKGVVTEVGPAQIKFRKSADGPVYVMNKTDIASVTYENGTVETYNEAPAANSATATSTTSSTASGKYNNEEDEPIDNRKHYGGPRLGFTCFQDGIISHQLGTNIVSQFGWQFETRFFTLPNGGSGLFEFVPLVGGMEKGKFLPSATALIGYRGGNGFELGVGPNLSMSGFGMVIAAGASFKSGHVCFPVNIAFQPSIDKSVGYSYYDANTGYYNYGQRKMPTGFKVSLLVGFNSRTK